MAPLKYSYKDLTDSERFNSVSESNCVVEGSTNSKECPTFVSPRNRRVHTTNSKSFEELAKGKSKSFHGEGIYTISKQKKKKSQSFNEEGCKESFNCNRSNEKPIESNLRIVRRNDREKFVEYEGKDVSTRNQLETNISRPKTLQLASSGQFTLSSETNESHCPNATNVTIEKYRQMYETMLNDSFKALIINEENREERSNPEDQRIHLKMNEEPFVSLKGDTDSNMNATIDKIIEEIKLKNKFAAEKDEPLYPGSLSVSASEIQKLSKQSTSNKNSLKNEVQDKRSCLRAGEREETVLSNSFLSQSSASKNSYSESHQRTDNNEKPNDSSYTGVRSQKSMAKKSPADRHPQEKRPSLHQSSHDDKPKRSSNTHSNAQMSRSTSPFNASVSSRTSHSPSRSTSRSRRFSFGSFRRLYAENEDIGMESFADELSDSEEVAMIRDVAHLQSSSEKKEKKSLLGKMKTLSAKVSRAFASPTKYKVGEKVAYNLRKKNKDSLERVTDDNHSVEVVIVAVHTDAVLEIPYYTIQLPDGSQKQTNMEHLRPLSYPRKNQQQFNSSKSNSSKRLPSHSEDIDDQSALSSKSVKSNRSKRSTKSEKSSPDSTMQSYHISQTSSNKNDARRSSSNARQSSRPSSRSRRTRDASTKASQIRVKDETESNSAKHVKILNNYAELHTPITSSSRIPSNSRLDTSSYRNNNRCAKDDEFINLRKSSQPRVDSMRCGYKTLPKTAINLREMDQQMNGVNREKSCREGPLIIKLKPRDSEGSSFALETAVAAAIYLR